MIVKMALSCQSLVRTSDLMAMTPDFYPGDFGSELTPAESFYYLHANISSNTFKYLLSGIKMTTVDAEGRGPNY